MVTPLLFMLSTSLKDASQVYDLRLIPAAPTLDNYIEILGDGRFTRWFVNSLIVAIIVTLSNVFFDSLVGYTLAKFRFRGRYIVFIAILSTLMIPTEMLVMPWYLMASQFGWLDSYWGIMFPGHDDGVRHLPDEAVLRERAGRLPRGGADRRAQRVHRSGGRSPCRW